MNKIIKHMDNISEFQGKLTDISKTWDQLILLSQLGSIGIDMSHIKTNFNALTEELTKHLVQESLNKITNEMKSKAQVAVDIVIRNLFERTADIGFLSTDDDIRYFLENIEQLKIDIINHKNDKDDTIFKEKKAKYKQNLINIKSRFKEYVNKYSVYYDIVLFNSNKEIVARLDDGISIKKTTDSIIDDTKITTQEYIETYKYHDFLPQYEKSLVYTYKVTNKHNQIIGYLSLCFKFEDEMEAIFSRLINKNNKETLLLLDKEGVVIASSDKYHIPINSKHEIDLNNKYNIATFAGRDYIVKTCKTNGYEGFYGLNWYGHIMIPLDCAFDFENINIEIDKKILYAIMKNEDFFKKELLEIPNKASLIQDELDRAVWNGNISQKEQQSENAQFARSILREVRNTGELTKESFNNSIKSLNSTIIGSLLDKAKFISSFAIDIMDRNLYERANDVRWWALTSTFKEILSKDTILNDDINKISDILKYINDLYTVYTNLFVYDKHGKILAISNSDEQKILNTNISNDWYKKTILKNSSSVYIVSDFEKTPYYNNQNSYIYNAPITNKNKVVGGIGIVFDSKPQFYDILNDAISDLCSDTFALFVNKKDKKIISSSDQSHNIDDILDINQSLFDLNNNESKSEIILYKNSYYIVGVTCSNGYREYKSNDDDYINDILSFVFIKAANNIQEEFEFDYYENQYYNYPISKDDKVEEIATFYVGDKWLGVNSSEILETISIDKLELPISKEEDQHHFKGTVIHKDYPVSVLDISKFVKNKISKEKHDVIIIKYDDSSNHTIGIAVDKLGEIIQIPTQYIKPFEEHLIGSGMLAQSIVQPPKGTRSKQLLTLLNISKISELKEDNI
jgi:chemotaxis signal transduction protein